MCRISDQLIVSRAGPHPPAPPNGATMSSLTRRYFQGGVKMYFGKSLRVLLLTIAAVCFLSIVSYAQLVPVNNTGLPLTLSMNVAAMSNPQSSQEELPGLGHKFELIGAMYDDVDPHNATNDTISDIMTPDNYALAYRALPPGIKIAALTDQLGFKYYFPAPRSCGGGSPRISLAIDSNGDGTADFTAHGHVDPPYAGCPMNRWVYQDLSDDLPRWEITPGGAVPSLPGYPYASWSAVVAAITTTFPNHKVLSGYLVDDSCSFFPATCGKAYYDLVTIENRTLENRQDTVKNGN